MSHMESALYSPYGAFELKAKYQRNFLFGTGLTLAGVILILAISWLVSAVQEEDVVSMTPTVIKTVADLGPPPTVAKKPPQVQVHQPQVAMPRVGIPKPVADDEVMDDDVVLATREELAEIVAPDITVTSEGGSDIVVDIEEVEYLPAIDEFVPVEIIAEMIYREEPKYPRLAEQAGLEGLVWVKALVSRDGTVKDAAVYRSSGMPSLDEAAVEAAFRCRYKPAIQNGRPVAMWVTYKVEFLISSE